MRKISGCHFSFSITPLSLSRSLLLYPYGRRRIYFATPHNLPFMIPFPSPRCNPVGCILTILTISGTGYISSSHESSTQMSHMFTHLSPHLLGWRYMTCTIQSPKDDQRTGTLTGRVTIQLNFDMEAVTTCEGSMRGVFWCLPRISTVLVVHCAKKTRSCCSQPSDCEWWKQCLYVVQLLYWRTLATAMAKPQTLVTYNMILKNSS